MTPPFPPTPWTDVTARGAAGDGVTDDTDTIQATIDALPPTGGTVYLPPGTYLVSAPLQLRGGLRLTGAGQQASVLVSTHTGDGLRMTSPVNSSTAVHVTVSDLSLTNTAAAANTGGGVVDVGGTYLRIERVTVTGFGYGVIFDQSELADIVASRLDRQSHACVWLVNGDDHLGAGSGVRAGFTNRIGVRNCQLSPDPTGAGIIDDGGNAHDFQGNNFNGGTRYLRLAGVDVCLIASNEMESASGDGIVVTYLTSVLGTGTGQCVNLTLLANEIVAPAEQRHCVQFHDGSPILSMGNLYSSLGAALAGVANCYSLTSIADGITGPGQLIDGKAGNQIVLGSPSRPTPTVTGSKAGNTALASLLTTLTDLGLITDDTT